MKKLRFVFILLLLLPFSACKTKTVNPVVNECLVEKPVETVDKTQGVLLERNVMGKWAWFKKEDLWPDSHSSPKGDKDRKYEGDVENGKPNGMGTFTILKWYGDYMWVDDPEDEAYSETTRVRKKIKELLVGSKYVGEFKQGQLCNVTCFDKDENICGLWVDGVKQ